MVGSVSDVSTVFGNRSNSSNGSQAETDNRDEANDELLWLSVCLLFVLLKAPKSPLEGARAPAPSPGLFVD